MNSRKFVAAVVVDSSHYYYYCNLLNQPSKPSEYHQNLVLYLFVEIHNEINKIEFPTEQQIVQYFYQTFHDQIDSRVSFEQEYNHDQHVEAVRRSIVFL